MKKLLFLVFISCYYVPIIGQQINTNACAGSQTNSCNLVCYGDFENLSKSKWKELIELDPNPGKAGSSQSPDLCKDDNTNILYSGFNGPPKLNEVGSICNVNSTGVVSKQGSTFLHFTETFNTLTSYREAIYLPLKEVLVPGKTYELSLEYYTGCTNQLNIAFSANKPCDYNTSVYDALPNFFLVPIKSVDCGGGLNFNPSFIKHIPVKGMDKWQTHTSTITIPDNLPPNLEDKSIRYIVLYSYYGNKSYVSTYYDNIEIRKMEADEPTVSTTVKEKCIGGKIVIEYTVKNNGVNNMEATFIPNSLMPSSIILTTTVPIVKNIPPMGTVTFTIEGTIPNTTTVPTNLTAQSILSITTCRATSRISIATPLTLTGESAVFSSNIDCVKQLLILKSANTTDKHKWEIYDDKSNLIFTATTPTVNFSFPLSGKYSIKHYLTNGCWTTLSIDNVNIACDACNCKNAVGIAGKVTLLSQTAFYKANTKLYKDDCVAINGVLQIDKDYTFENVNFNMNDESASIKVNDGIKLNIYKSSYLHGCETMWNSINLGEKANFIFADSRMEDALYGVTTGKNVNVNIKNNIFKRNYRGISVAGNNSTIKIGLLGIEPISGNTFTCYNTTFKKNSKNYSSNFAVGIEVSKATMEIGRIGWGRNIFEGLQYGILAWNNADISTTANDFKNISYDGINATNSIVNVKNSTFKTMDIGIYGYQSTLLTSNELSMYDVKQGIQIQEPTNINITSCKNISAGWRGIKIDGKMFANTLPPSIQNVTINGFNNNVDKSNYANWYGIWMLYVDIPKPSFFSIKDVTINSLYNSAAVTNPRNVAFHHGSSKGLKFENSFLNLGILSPKATNIDIGININNAERAIIKNIQINGTSQDLNLLSGTSGSGKTISASILSSVKTSICCSNTNGTAIGFHLGGDFTSFQMKNNIIGTHNYGLSIQSPTSIITPQENGQNIWVGKYAKNGAYHSGGQNTAKYQKNIDLSRFNIADPITQNNQLWAQNNIFPKLQNNAKIDWFQQKIAKSLKCEDVTECKDDFIVKLKADDESRGDEDEVITENDIAAADGSYRYIANTNKVSWQAAYYLYQKLSEYPTLKENNKLMITFFDSVQQTNIARFYKIENEIDKSLELNNSERIEIDNLWDIRSHYQEEAAMYNELWSETQDINEQAEIEKQRDYTEQLWTENSERYFWALSELKQNRLEKIQSLIAINDEIQPTGKWEENEKIVNDIYLKTVMSSNLKLDEQQAQILANVAFQCEIEGGKAVLKARELFQIWQDRYFQIQDFCAVENTNSSVENSESSKVIKNNSEQVNIYPNPAQTELHLDIPLLTTDVAELSIVSMTGEIVIHKNNLDSSNLLDISNMQNGLYLCYVYRNNILVSTQKLIILK